MEKKPILKVSDFGVAFAQYAKGIQAFNLEVITNLDIELYPGEILAVVGSSGSGKSLLAHGILGILPENAMCSGHMYYDNKEIKQTDKERLRGKDIVLIPQSVNYLDPLEKVGSQIDVSLRGRSKQERRRTAIDMLARYGLCEEVYDMYPHQLSGGMARKVLLCTALAAGAKVIIADEPTPGLDDASLQEVLKDVRALADEGMALLMITHDINAACKIADKIAIFYAGSTLEIASASDMSGDGEKLRHPYTKALWRAVPSNKFEAIEGTQPMPGELPAGCLFSERCPKKTAECCMARPPMKELRCGKVRCFHAT